MSDILFNAAQAYKELSKFDYMLTLGNRKYKILISSINTKNELFHHVVGLGHLSDIRMLEAKTLRQKNAIYNAILKGRISFNDIENSVDLYAPICETFNKTTNAPYTYYDRIEAFSDVNKYFDIAYTGKMFRWNINKSNIVMPNGNIRHSKIKADFLLKIPSLNTKDEFFYCFLHQLNSNSSKDEIIRLNAHSIFLDCVDLSQGQEKPYTILQEKKINIRTHEEEILFQHPKYIEPTASSKYIQVLNVVEHTADKIEAFIEDDGFDDIEKENKREVSR